MTTELASPPGLEKATRVRYGVLGFACALSMVTYLDRVCFGSVAGYIKTEFGLDDVERGYLFGAFALAYAAFEVPSGWLGDIFGPRKTLLRIVLWWSFFTALTGLIWPIAGWVQLCFWFLVLVRFCFGMGEAGAYPNITRAVHNWFPFGERGFAKGTVWMSGRLMGGLTPVIVFTLIYTDSSNLVHWRHSFWIFGALGVLWAAAFAWWFRDRPEQMPAVNAAELALIRESKQGPLSGAAKSATPWRAILTSANLWLLCGQYFSQTYGWYFNITYLPEYLRQTYGLSGAQEPVRVGLLSGAPLLSGSLACLLGGLCTDAYIRRTGNRKWGRRLFGVIGQTLCGLCYFASIFADNVYVFVFVIAMAAFWNDTTMGPSWASCIDIGRKYSGVVSGCMNTIGNLAGAVAGVLTGRILQHYADNLTLGWQINFISFAGLSFVGAVCWLFFDSTKPVCNED